MAKGDTKTEDLLDILGSGGTSPYPRNSATKTQNYIMDAIDRVNTLEQEIEEIAENPDVADIVATYADLQAYDTKKLTNNAVLRVLADETHDGDSTYYRYNKKNDTFTYIGSIPTAEPGAAKILTTADYNYPTNNPTGVALWLLDPGLYDLPADVVGYTQVYFSNPQAALKGSWLVTHGTFDSDPSAGLYLFNGTDKPQYYTTKISDGSRIKGQTFFTKIVDNLTSTGTDDALSAKQGKVLKGLVDGISQSGAGAPTTSTVGTVGQLYQDTTNGKLYICTAADTVTPSYTWAEVGAGGGSGVVELTSADYNVNSNNWEDTDPANFNCVALWKLEPGVYKWGSDMRVSADAGWISGSITYNQGGAIILKGAASGNATIIMQGSYGIRNVFETVTSTGRATGTSDTQIGGPQDILLAKSVYKISGSTIQAVRIGKDAATPKTNAVAIGENSYAYTNGTAVGFGASTGMNGPNTALGYNATMNNNTIQYSVALGANSKTTRTGEVNIGGSNGTGFNSTDYRVIGGVHDGQDNHDAATVAQGNKLMTTAPTTTDAGVLGQLWTDTTAMHTYQLTAIDTTDPNNPSYSWTQRW